MTLVSAASEVPTTQGSEAWRLWRRTRIGSSDMPIILCESEFDTPRGLWRKKKGIDPDEGTNFAMNRGTENEPKIRALYELQTMRDVPPSIVVHPDLDWAMASLDGDNEDDDILVEFKYPSAETHAIAKSGQIPPKYYGQVQWQLFVSGRKRAHYVSLDPDGTTIAIVETTLNPEYAARMIEKATEFYALLQGDIPPPLTDRDYKDIESAEADAVFSAWRTAKLADDKNKMDSLRASILSFMDHPKIRCAGVKAQMVKRKNGPTLQVSLAKSAADEVAAS